MRNLSYLKISFRNFKKYKGYSFLNITGLVLGIAGSMLIFQYAYNELSYDDYHDNAERI